MTTYKITLVYSPAPNVFSSRSRFVQALSKTEAIEAARRALRLPANANPVRIEVM